jgi:hypothetical protein
LGVDFFSLKTDKEFVNKLEDNIREQRARDKLVRDFAKSENSSLVQQIFHALCISSWVSKPNHKNPNFAENC